MISKEEKTKWILENCVDKYGSLDLSGLDFSDFDGDVDISKMKVNGSLLQCFQTVQKDLFQEEQTVQGDLLQNKQKVQGDLLQNKQKVQGDLLQNKQKVKGDLYQSCQTVQGDLLQGYQTVQGSFITQILAEDEEYEIKGSNTYIVKKRKKLTQEEIEELLGYEIEII